MCLIPLFLFPTTLIEELLLVVEAVNDFGGLGWQDCQSSPTRTLYPRFWLFISSRRHSSSHHELKNAQALHFRVLAIAAHLHAGNC